MSLLAARRDPNWIGCIDFGTALSKCVMVRAVGRDELGSDHIRPLAIAVRPGFIPRNPYLLPSIIFVSNNYLLFGQEAEEAAVRAERTGRHAFVSPKQYLSTHDLEDLDQQLQRDVDPTAKFTARDLLKLFLAHLLERAGNDAREQHLKWPVALRIARPAWSAKRADDGEEILKSLVGHGFELVDRLGTKLSTKGGLSHESAVEALGNLRPATDMDNNNIFKLNSEGKASVLEATAVAAGSIRDTGRRVVAVADIGGGTSDFGAFMTGLPHRHVLAEIRDSSRVLREAGDYLDMQLRRHILSVAGFLPDDPAALGTSNRLRARGRMNKDILFTEGHLIVEVGDDLLEIALEEFLADQHVVAFANRLQSRFHETLSIAVSCARNYRQPNGRRTPVEILLTGGGHALPMVRSLCENPSVSWTYTTPALDLAERPEDTDFHAVRRQLAVAIGGAVRDLPTQTAPIRV
jgi:molecular chaperone DnaK (HSP70)